MKDNLINMADKELIRIKEIQRRTLPAELLNELFSSLELKNGFRLLAKMPNNLLAGNVQKMINSIKMVQICIKK